MLYIFTIGYTDLLQNIEEFITLCLQLAVESVSTMTKDEDAKLHIILPKGKYSEVFNTIIEDDNFLKVCINSTQKLVLSNFHYDTFIKIKK